MNAKWGSDFAQRGFILRPDESGLGSHRFGGFSWSIFSRKDLEDQPLFLFEITTKISDVSKLLETLNSDVLSIPIVSYINSDFWWTTTEQQYIFDSKRRHIRWIYPYEIDPLTFKLQNNIQSPLPGKSARLEKMTDADLPTSEENYWRIGEEFLGGDKFIRVLGSPYWLQGPIRTQCSCGAAMHYFASIGHERLDHPGQFTSKPFFIGEASLYFFICLECRKISIKMQSS